VAARVGVGAGLAIVFVSVVSRLSIAGLVSLSVTDLRPWLAVGVAVAVTGVAACFLPARRAATHRSARGPAR
jgi:hypothetical protein